MKKANSKKVTKIDKIDSYITRYRENLKLQDELEKKRKNKVLGVIFGRRQSVEYQKDNKA